MVLSERSRKALLGVIAIACGILGLVLFMWTPTTSRGIFVYSAMFAVLIVMAIVLSSGKRGGYWPSKPEDR
jgi:heme/copper-type cytochrome/quinol oxidase subunit 4